MTTYNQVQIYHVNEHLRNTVMLHNAVAASKPTDMLCNICCRLAN